MNKTMAGAKTSTCMWKAQAKVHQPIAHNGEAPVRRCFSPAIKAASISTPLKV